MNRFEMVALVTGALATWLCGWQLVATWELYLRGGQLSGPMMVIGLAGWAVANYGAVVAALLLWRWSKASRRPWVLHLLLVPALYLSMAVGGWMMMFAMEVSHFDSAIGAPLFPGLLLIPFALLGYVAALIFKLLSPAPVASEPDRGARGGALR
jgi:hypothetical protein